MHFKMNFLVFISLCISICVVLCSANDEEPSVVLVILIRNKAYMLPYFFTYLGNLNYPKERITLWCV